MWFKRKNKNRRLGREYVLDVKLRSSQVRAARMRMAGIALGVVFATVLGCGLVWRGGGWLLDRLVYENKAFAVDHIDIQTDGVLAPDQLQRWAGVRRGQNLFALDLVRVRRNLEMISLVQKASVERILPRTLFIRVLEREPLAQLRLPGPRPGGGVEEQVFYLDEAGYVILPMDTQPRAPQASDPPPPLPLIAGLSANDVQAGRSLDFPQVHAALRLIQAFEGSPMNGMVDLKRIDVSSPEVLVVTTGQGNEITFGLDGLEQQLRRWRAIYDYGQDRQLAIRTLDLAVTNNVPTCWVEAGPAPLPPDKPTRTARKKHV